MTTENIPLKRDEMEEEAQARGRRSRANGGSVGQGDDTAARITGLSLAKRAIR